MGLIMHDDISYGGGGGSDLEVVELTKAEYDALTLAQKTDLTKVYCVTDYDAGGATIDDTTTALDSVWSSSKTSQMIAANGFQFPKYADFDSLGSITDTSQSSGNIAVSDLENHTALVLLFSRQAKSYDVTLQFFDEKIIPLDLFTLTAGHTDSDTPLVITSSITHFMANSSTPTQNTDYQAFIRAYVIKYSNTIYTITPYVTYINNSGSGSYPTGWKFNLHGALI